MTHFFLLEIIDMNEPSREIKLCFEFDAMEVQFSNFNRKGELILFCSVRTNIRYDYINIVCVYSIQTETKCQKIYKVPKEAEIISISKHDKNDKIWFRLNHNIYEWNLFTGHTTMILNDIYEVIINFKILLCC